MSREALSFPAYMPFLLFSKEGIRVKLAFTKMHGCGNNYIYFNCFDQTVPDPESLSIKLSEPHFGIGGDGIILISPSDKADAQMRIFNADGSEGKMCGNGIRCVGKYLYDNGMTDGRTTITIDTLSRRKMWMTSTLRASDPSSSIIRCSRSVSTPSLSMSCRTAA